MFEVSESPQPLVGTSTRCSRSPSSSGRSSLPGGERARCRQQHRPPITAARVPRGGARRAGWFPSEDRTPSPLNSKARRRRQIAWARSCLRGATGAPTATTWNASRPAMRSVAARRYRELGQPFQQGPDLGRTVTEHRCRQYVETLRVVLLERLINVGRPLWHRRSLRPWAPSTATVLATDHVAVLIVPASLMRSLGAPRTKRSRFRGTAPGTRDRARPQ
jgi:hypothetical protein